jgi:hypothetical protein
LGDIADGGLDEDLLALVAGLLQPVFRLRGIVGERGQPRIEVIVALGDGPARNDTAPLPQLLDDQLAVDSQRERLLHQRIVERRPLAVDA